MTQPPANTPIGQNFVDDLREHLQNKNHLDLESMLLDQTRALDAAFRRILSEADRHVTYKPPFGGKEKNEWVMSAEKYNLALRTQDLCCRTANTLKSLKYIESLLTMKKEGGGGK